MASTREERLTARGPKRILAIDACGARGVLAAGLLGALEAQLRRERGDPNLRLWDYFDLIGGLSGGALLAGALAAGASVEEACGLYIEAGPDPKAAPKGDPVRRPKFDRARLEACLDEAFGDAHIGDARIRVGLALLVKPLEAAAPEIWSNAPGAATKDKSFVEAILASIGGESLFDGRPGFADAALCGAPSPVWPLLRLAMSPRGLGWPAGPGKISIVSLGAGRLRPSLPARVFEAAPDPNPAALAANVATRAGFALESAVFEAGEEALAALTELCDPAGGGRAFAPCDLQRIDVELSQEALTRLGFGAAEIQAATERRPVNAQILQVWRRIGEAASASAVAGRPTPDAPANPPASAKRRGKLFQPAESVLVAPEAPQPTQGEAPAQSPPGRRPRSRLEALAGVLGGKPEAGG